MIIYYAYAKNKQDVVVKCRFVGYKREAQKFAFQKWSGHHSCGWTKLNLPNKSDVLELLNEGVDV